MSSPHRHIVGAMAGALHELQTQILPAGTAAPDFELGSAPGETVRLSACRGSSVVLVFYPADWSPVCGDQMTLYNEIFDEFAEFDAKIFGISVDGVWCHQAYAKNRKLRFPLLADFEPKGEVSRRYGAYDPGSGTSLRALYVIDAKGVIRWSYLSPIDINPGADGILTALESLAAERQTS
jgi:peroxiredoxin